MRSTPEQDARLRARLQEAIDRFSGGSADDFARKIGYANGGYVREVMTKKPVRRLASTTQAWGGSPGQIVSIDRAWGLFVYSAPPL